MQFNTLEWPFDDLKVRQAFSYAWDLDKLMDKLFFNEYVATNSYWPWSKYEHPDNPIQDYNPDKALQLLNEAGWQKNPDDKWLSKNDKIFEVDMYTYTGWDRIHNFLVNDLEAIGIKLNLVVIQNPFEKFMKKKSIELLIFLGPSYFIQLCEKINFIVNIYDINHILENYFPEYKNQEIFDEKNKIITKQKIKL